MSVAPVTYDAMLDGIVAQLQPLRIPTGAQATPTAYLRELKRFMGEQFDPEDAAERGIAGRTPAVLVAFAGEKPFRKTIGGRRQRLEASFAVICVSDSRRSKDDRAVVLAMIYDVRKLLSNRKLGLPIQPLQYAGIAVVAENDLLFAYAARFTTRYVADYTVDPGADLLLSVRGQIVIPLDAPAAPTAPSLTVRGTPGTARYAYDLQVQFADGPFTDFSPWADVQTGPTTLGGANTIGVSWPAYASATAYRLRRRWTPPGGPAVGVIYTGPATSFIDDGSVAGDGDTVPARGLNYSEDF